MKKIFKDRKTNLIILSILIVILIIVIIVSVVSHKSNGINKNNKYTFKDKVVEMPGTKVISTEVLSSEHCLGDICLTDTKFYENGNEGRVESRIKNNGDKEKSGYLKIKVNDVNLIITYKDLKSGGEVNVVSKYSGINLGEIEDFTLEKLTKKERKSIMK